MGREDPIWEIGGNGCLFLVEELLLQTLFDIVFQEGALVRVVVLDGVCREELE